MFGVGVVGSKQATPAVRGLNVGEERRFSRRQGDCSRLLLAERAERAVYAASHGPMIWVHRIYAYHGPMFGKRYQHTKDASRNLVNKK